MGQTYTSRTKISGSGQLYAFLASSKEEILAAEHRDLGAKEPRLDLVKFLVYCWAVNLDRPFCLEDRVFRSYYRDTVVIRRNHRKSVEEMYNCTCAEETSEIAV